MNSELHLKNKRAILDFITKHGRRPKYKHLETSEKYLAGMLNCYCSKKSSVFDAAFRAEIAKVAPPQLRRAGDKSLRRAELIAFVTENGRYPRHTPSEQQIFTTYHNYCRVGSPCYDESLVAELEPLTVNVKSEAQEKQELKEFVEINGRYPRREYGESLHTYVSRYLNPQRARFDWNLKRTLEHLITKKSEELWARRKAEALDFIKLYKRLPYTKSQRSKHNPSSAEIEAYNTINRFRKPYGTDLEFCLLVKETLRASKEVKLNQELIQEP